MIESLMKQFLGKKEMKQDEAPQADLKELSEKLVNTEQLVLALNTALAEKETLLTELSGKLAEYQSIADEAKASAEAIQAAAELAALENKKAKLADVIGKDNPSFDALFGVVEKMEEEQFGTMLESFKAAFIAQDNSPMFKEVGVAGEAAPVDTSAGLNIKKHLSTKKSKK